MYLEKIAFSEMQSKLQSGQGVFQLKCYLPAKLLLSFFILLLSLFNGYVK